MIKATQQGVAKIMLFGSGQYTNTSYTTGKQQGTLLVIYWVRYSFTRAEL